MVDVDEVTGGLLSAMLAGETADAREIGRMLRLDPVEASAILDAGAASWHDVRATLPEEFTGWLDDTAAQLQEEVDTVLAATRARAEELRELPAATPPPRWQATRRAVSCWPRSTASRW